MKKLILIAATGAVLVAGTPTAGAAEVVKSKTVVANDTKLKLELVTSGSKVLLRTKRGETKVAQITLKKIKAGEGSKLTKLVYQRYSNGKPTSDRSANGQADVHWTNPNGTTRTLYIGVTKDGLDQF